MGRTTRLGRNGQKMHRRPWKRLLHFFSVWFSWFSETESGCCCDNGANLLVIDSNLDSIYAFQLSDGVPNASIRCFIFHSIPDIAWALQSILIKEGLKKKENQNTKDHFVNSVPRIEKSPYLAQTLRNKLESGELFIHKIHTLSDRTTYNGSEDTMHRFKNKDYKRAHKDLNCNFKQCSSPGLSRNEQPYDCC